MRWLLAALLACCATTAGAQQDAASGDFDFYVLALSWSPTYCLSAGSNDRQCGSGGPRGFVVHGLWPQYESGYPQYCGPRRRIPRKLVDSMLDLMPDARLVYSEWDKHGTCSGLTPAAYFDLTRKAHARVAIPAGFAVDAAARTDPQSVEQAFIAANDGLRADMLAVICDRGDLGEVRICLDRQLGFTACPQVDARACRARRLAVPAAD